MATPLNGSKTSSISSPEFHHVRQRQLLSALHRHMRQYRDGLLGTDIGLDGYIACPTKPTTQAINW